MWSRKLAGNLLSRVKPCSSDTEPGVVEETIRIKEQPEMICIMTREEMRLVAIFA